VSDALDAMLEISRTYETTAKMFREKYPKQGVEVTQNNEIDTKRTRVMMQLFRDHKDDVISKLEKDRETPMVSVFLLIGVSLEVNF